MTMCLNRGKQKNGLKSNASTALYILSTHTNAAAAYAAPTWNVAQWCATIDPQINVNNYTPLGGKKEQPWTPKIYILLPRWLPALVA